MATVKYDKILKVVRENDAEGIVTHSPIIIVADTLLATPQAGAIEYDGTGLFFTPTSIRRFLDMTSDPKVTTTTVANTVVETVIYSITVPGDELRVGSMVTLEVYGYFSTANASDTFTMRLKKNSTTVLSVTSSPKSSTNAAFDTKAVFTIRSLGVGGTSIGHLITEIDSTAVSVSELVPSAIDTTASTTFSVTIQWSAALNGNTLSCTQGVGNFMGG